MNRFTPGSIVCFSPDSALPNSSPHYLFSSFLVLDFKNDEYILASLYDADIMLKTLIGPIPSLFDKTHDDILSIWSSLQSLSREWTYNSYRDFFGTYDVIVGTLSHREIIPFQEVLSYENSLKFSTANWDDFKQNVYPRMKALHECMFPYSFKKLPHIEPNAL